MSLRILAFIAALLLALPLSPQAVAEDDVIKVVYHADFADPRRFSAMLTSINNMVTHYQNELIEYDVRIVFVAHGIRFLTGDKLENTPFAADAALDERRDNLAGRLGSLNTVQGVKLELCDITRSQTDQAGCRQACGRRATGSVGRGAHCRTPARGLCLH